MSAVRAHNFIRARSTVSLTYWTPRASSHPDGRRRTPCASDKRDRLDISGRVVPRLKRGGRRRRRTEIHISVNQGRI